MSNLFTAVRVLFLWGAGKGLLSWTEHVSSVAEAVLPRTRSEPGSPGNRPSCPAAGAGAGGGGAGGTPRPAAFPASCGAEQRPPRPLLSEGVAPRHTQELRDLPTGFYF